MPSRIIVRLEMTPAAKHEVERLCDEMGMKQVALISRVLEWFGKQDSLAQRSILGHIPPELQRTLGRLYSRKMKRSSSATSRHLFDKNVRP